MPDVVAKAMAVITSILLVASIAILVVTSRPPAGTQEIVAEFQDAFPMLEGMQVRTNGAVAGSTGSIEVNDKGLAEITLLVEDTVPAPKADAAATIRQADSTGDSYIAYDPGKASEPLEESGGVPTIACDAPSATAPCRSTLATPRLDDLINAFGGPEQAGVKLILTELSQALAERGDDVNRAALDLVPTLDAANTALAEVNSQNTALKAFITDMEDVTGQAASRRTELGGLIESLASTLDETASRTRPLDAGLAALPATARELRGTLASLTDAARGTRPLAAQLSATAPGLSTLLDRAPGFIDDVRVALRTARPTLGLTRKLLVAGAPTIAADPQRVVTGAFDLAPALSNLLKGILGGDETIRGIFGDDADGAAETREGFGFGLGAVATDPGNQPGYPADWEDRRFVRLSLKLSCEMFGVAVSPGCLARALTARTAQDNPVPVLQARKGAVRRAPVATAPAPSVPAASLPGAPEDATPVVAQPLNVLPLTQQTLDQLTGSLGLEKTTKPAGDLLDFLLRP